MVLFLACQAPDDPGSKDSGLSDSAGGDSAGGDSAGGESGEEAPPGTLGTLRAGDAPVLLQTWPTVNYRGIDAAWDEATGAFLVVIGNAPVGGVFLDADGGQVGAGFHLPEDDYDGANWTQNPRVVADDGGWLASWHREYGHGPVVEVRRVRLAGDAPAWDGPPIAVSAAGSQQESPAALGWSAARQEHLVAWAANGLYGRRLGPDGTPLAEPFALTEAGTWVEMPAVVEHPGCSCFFVTTMQATEAGARVLLLRVGPDGVLGEPADLTGAVDFAKVTDLVYDAWRGEVVATWYEIRAGVPGFAAQAFDADGAAVGAATPVFTPFGSYDGYDLAWSAVSGTSLGVFHGPTAAAVAAELSVTLTSGAPLTLDAAGAVNGFFLPHAIAHPTEPRWLVFGAPDYAAVAAMSVWRDP